MDFETIKAAFVAFVRANQDYAPFVVGLLTFGESLAFLSLLLPATAILVTVGFLLTTMDIPFWHVWLGAAVGAGAGDWVSFAIGQRFKTAAYGVWPLSRNPHLITRGEHFFLRFGPWAVFIGRFFGPARAVIPLVAGIFLMPPVLFQLANWASSFVWAFLLLAPGAGLMELLSR
ncbi:DedA family protein [Microvirga sp. 2MCAF38]|uniref:DedA family protein n=1 Tax=Microvirga sp. 2MCAF38 TaxID=3232989 RepID=UPI003F99387F